MRPLSAIVSNCQFVLYPLNVDMNIEGSLKWPGQPNIFLSFAQFTKKCCFDYIRFQHAYMLACGKNDLCVVTIKFVIISAEANTVKL